MNKSDYLKTTVCLNSILVLFLFHSSRGSVRKARESHLVDKAMALEHCGLNKPIAIDVMNCNLYLYQFFCVFLFMLSFPPLPFKQYFYCYILHLYSIAIPINNLITPVNLKKVWPAEISLTKVFNTRCFQMCSSLCTSRFLVL